jgi:hypothetical protein
VTGPCPNKCTVCACESSVSCVLRLWCPCAEVEGEISWGLGFVLWSSTVGTDLLRVSIIYSRLESSFLRNKQWRSSCKDVCNVMSWKCAAFCQPYLISIPLPCSSLFVELYQYNICDCIIESVCKTLYVLFIWLSTRLIPIVVAAVYV